MLPEQKWTDNGKMWDYYYVAFEFVIRLSALIFFYLGELPVIKNLNRLPAGMYIFNISATDIYRLHDAFIIKYTSKYEITCLMASIMENYNFLINRGATKALSDQQ